MYKSERLSTTEQANGLYTIVSFKSVTTDAKMNIEHNIHGSLPALNGYFFINSKTVLTGH